MRSSIAIQPLAACASQGNEATLAAAIEYQHRGLSVFPCVARTKVPAVRAWKPFQKHAPSRQQLELMFSDRDTSVAVILGPVSGDLICRDFDRMDCYEQWADEHPSLAAELPTVATSRGRHVYFRGQMPDKRARIDLDDATGHQGELRGHGSYNMLPPSVHQDGPVYEWIVPLGDTIPRLTVQETGLMPAEWWQGFLNKKTRHVTKCNTRGNIGVGEHSLTALHTDRLSLSALSLEIQGCILRSLPGRAGQRHSCIFRLARELKAIARLHDASSDQLQPIIRAWHSTALPVIGTKEWERTWRDFVDGWRRVRRAASQNSIQALWKASSSTPTPKFAIRYRKPAQRALATLCGVLQASAGESPFFLDCRTAGELLGVTHVTAWRWLSQFVADGLLQLVSVGTHASKRASCYRFNAKE